MECENVVVDPGKWVRGGESPGRPPSPHSRNIPEPWKFGAEGGVGRSAPVESRNSSLHVQREVSFGVGVVIGPHDVHL